MNHETNKPSILGEALIDTIRQAVREEMREVIGQNGHEDHLLDTDEAAKVLSVSPDWLYRHAKHLPFTRKLGPKMLRFSHLGMQKYLATRKPS